MLLFINDLYVRSVLAPCDIGVIFADDGHDGLGAILVDGIVENVLRRSEGW